MLRVPKSIGSNKITERSTPVSYVLLANEKIDRLKYAADMLIVAELVPGSAVDKRAARDDAAIKVSVHFHDSDLPTFRRAAHNALGGQVTFHWPLEFPEVMAERSGFDGIVGNPPFVGGQLITSRAGKVYRGIPGSEDCKGEERQCRPLLVLPSSLLFSIAFYWNGWPYCHEHYLGG